MFVFNAVESAPGGGFLDLTSFRTKPSSQATAMLSESRSLGGFLLMLRRVIHL